MAIATTFGIELFVCAAAIDGATFALVPRLSMLSVSQLLDYFVLYRRMALSPIYTAPRRPAPGVYRPSGLAPTAQCPF